MGSKVSFLTATDSLFAVKGVSARAWHATLLQLGMEVIWFATQTGTTFVRWGWTALCVLQDVPGAQASHQRESHAKLPPVDQVCFCPHLPSFPLFCVCNHTLRVKNQNLLLLFFSFPNRFYWCVKSDIKHPAHLLWGEGLLVRRADVHVFRVFVLLRALCESVKEALDHSMETQTVCAVQWALSLSRHQCANIQCALCVCARVCVRVSVWTCKSALFEGKCLMG